jgi:hypothetical protein
MTDLELTGLYTERAQCVLALARAAKAAGCVVGFRNDPALDEVEAARWPVLFIDLPTGQVSWHLTIEDRRSAADIDIYLGEWDRHDTAEKYRRLAAWQPACQSQEHERCAGCDGCVICGECIEG